MEQVNQNTERLKNHEIRISKHDKNFHRMEITLTKIEGTTTHLKDRIDNGLSVTINKVLDTIERFIPLIQKNTIVSDKIDPMIPDIKSNTKTCGMVEWAFRHIAIVAVGGGLIALAYYLVKNFA